MDGGTELGVQERGREREADAAAAPQEEDLVDVLTAERDAQRRPTALETTVVAPKGLVVKRPDPLEGNAEDKVGRGRAQDVVLDEDVDLAPTLAWKPRQRRRLTEHIVRVSGVEESEGDEVRARNGTPLREEFDEAALGDKILQMARQVGHTSRQSLIPSPARLVLWIRVDVELRERCRRH